MGKSFEERFSGHHLVNPSFSSTVFEVARLYDDHVDTLIENPTYFEKLIDLEGNGIDMDMLRDYCKRKNLRGYSPKRFMEFLSMWFEVEYKDVKDCLGSKHFLNRKESQ